MPIKKPTGHKNAHFKNGSLQNCTGKLGYELEDNGLNMNNTKWNPGLQTASKAQQVWPCTQTEENFVAWLDFIFMEICNLKQSFSPWN